MARGDFEGAHGCGTVLSAAAVPFADDDFNAIQMVSSAERSGMTLCSRTTDTQALRDVIRSAIRADYDLLSELPADVNNIPADFCGALWPDGEPEFTPKPS